VDCVHLIRNLLTIILLVLGFGTGDSLRAAEQAELNGLSGTWLISVGTYDAFIETGVIVPEFPVLVVDKSSEVRAYRFGTDCRGDLTVSGDVPEVEKMKPCIRARAYTDKDQMTGVATPVFVGKLQKSGTSWRIAINDSQAFQDAVKNSGTMNPVVEGIPFQYFLFHKLATESFSARLEQDQLRIVFQSSSHEPINFSRVDQTRLSRVGALQNALFLTFGRYFRCAHERFHDDQALDIAGRHRLLMNQTDLLYYYSEVDAAAPFDPANAERGLRQLDELKMLALARFALTTELNSTLAGRAARAGQFGRQLGCPERDQY
jgi:hypothetical protein